MRTLAVLVLLAALVGLAVAEQLSISRVYGHMKTETAALIEIVTDYPDDPTFAAPLRDRADALRAYWAKNERRLAILIRHIDLTYISDSLLYAQNFILANNKEETLAGLRRLEYFLASYSTVYGLNGVNIL